MAVVGGRVLNDKKYFANLFRLGLLRRIDIAESMFKTGRWEMIVVTSSNDELQVETARGEPKTFASLEAARQFAADIGFSKMEISW